MALSAVVFISVLSSNYILSRQLLEEYVSTLAKTTAAATASKLESVFDNVASNADSLAAVVASSQLDEQQIQQTLKSFLDSSPSIFGMTVALEPHTLIPALGDFSPYYYRADESEHTGQPRQLLFSNLASSHYQYKKWPWYQKPRQLGTAVWSEPYLDTGGGNVLMTTYATPIFTTKSDNKNTPSATRTFAGVATADIELGWLDETVKKIKIGQSGFGFIVSRKDIVIAHPDKHLNMKKLTDTIDHEVLPANWDKYQQSKQSSNSVYLHSPCRHLNGYCWVAVEALGNTGWKVIIVIPEQELIASINQLTVKNTIIAVTGLLLLFATIIFIARRLTQPLARLTRATRDIGEGKLDIALPEPAHYDEIGALTNDFNNMRESLKTYIDELQLATRKRQKLESEIQIAKDIQMSMLPGAGYASEDSKYYALFARLIPARTVGGDLYFYQHYSEQGKTEQLHFIVGDVSDKGVPAALFMAKTTTLYTRALKDSLSPGQTLAMMNDILAENNEACMFVTALCGCIDLTTGTVVMSNAGHMNPIIHNKNQTSVQTVDGATALGLMDGIDYPDVTFHLSASSCLIMYTDGISEAHNKHNEQYTDEGLLEFISTQTTDTETPDTKTLGSSILESVEIFSAGTTQFDDITLFIFQRK